MATAHTTHRAAEPKLTEPPLKVAMASFIGTAIEWYDFFIYGTTAALVFGVAFFPSGDAAAATIASFGTFAVGFFARPIGAALAGHFGDKIGRKKMLILCLLVMGGSTFLMGLLPTYAEIGLWAAMLLIFLRVLQGLGVGGEWGGAGLMAVEHSPSNRRGFYSAFPQVGVAAGVILSNVTFIILDQALSEEDFMAWGWRIPFLASVLLVIVGLWIRKRISESPVFRAYQESLGDVAQSKDAPSRFPIIDAFRYGWRDILRVATACIGHNALGYLVLVYLLSYATVTLGLDRSLVLTFVLVAVSLEIVATLFFGSLSDRLGRRPVYLGGAFTILVVAVAFFPVINTGNPIAVFAVILVARLGIAAIFGPMAAMFSEMFPTNTRFTGISLGFQLGSLIGAITPLVAAALLAATGNTVGISIFVSACVVVTIISVLTMKETNARDLQSI